MAQLFAIFMFVFVGSNRKRCSKKRLKRETCDWLMLKIPWIVLDSSFSEIFLRSSNFQPKKQL